MRTIIILSCILFSINTFVASASGSDQQYYGALPMRDICINYFPKYEEQIVSEYNKWIDDNKEQMALLKSKANYKKIEETMGLLIQHSVTNKEVSMRDLKYKCINFYENLSSI